jgi:MoaA/NifB/PqqE/SkfB family radical SAM enzyme
MNSFNPDLIVEVTKVCNRACSGCYAPNVLSRESSHDLIKKDPGLFLNIADLQFALLSLGVAAPRLVSIRGGEPSLHPDLSGILNVLRFFSQEIVIETHGRWALNKSLPAYQDLLTTIRFNKAKVKVSFDSMHGLSSDELLEIISNLEGNGIEYLIAITENGVEAFHETRRKVSWVEDNKIIYQPKAAKQEELYSPPIGVINSKGQISGTLTDKFSPLKTLNTVESAVG